MIGVPLILLLLVGSIGAGYAYFVGKPWAQQLVASVSGDLQAGATDLQAGTDAVHKANSTHDLKLLDQAQADFNSSRAKFEHARSRVQSEWALRQASRVPWLGSNYVTPRTTVVTQVATMGIALTDAGQDTTAVDRQLLAPGDKALTGGQRLIGVLTTTRPALDKIQVDLDRASKAAALVNVSLLPANQGKTLAKARDQIATGLAGIEEFLRLSPVILEILGANGPRSYLIEQVDPAELRGAGGFIGSYSTLSADHGILKLGKSGDVGLIDSPYPLRGTRKYVAPPNSSLQFTQHGWVFGDSNFASDFPSAAKTGQTLFLNETGVSVDGVISIDPMAIGALLQVTGPIPIPEYNTTADGATFAEQVFQRQEKLSLIVPGKKRFFPVVADKLIEKVSTLPSESWPGLLNILNGAVQGRHLQVYFNNSTVEGEMARINWAGVSVAPTADRETMLEVESNYGGTKANHYVDRSYDLTLVADKGTLQHHLVVTVKNSTPDGYEGGRQYTAYLRFYYPASATDAVTKGLTADRYPSDEKPAGVKLTDGWFNVEADLRLGNGTHQFSIDYTTDIEDLAAAGHQIYWQKQAGTVSDRVHVTLQTGGGSFTADTDLSQDRLLTLSSHGVQVAAGNVPTAHLPVLGG